MNRLAKHLLAWGEAVRTPMAGARLATRQERLGGYRSRAPFPASIFSLNRAMRATRVADFFAELRLIT